MLCCLFLNLSCDLVRALCEGLGLSVIKNCLSKRPFRDQPGIPSCNVGLEFLQRQLPPRVNSCCLQLVQQVLIPSCLNGDFVDKHWRYQTYCSFRLQRGCLLIGCFDQRAQLLSRLISNWQQFYKTYIQFAIRVSKKPPYQHFTGPLTAGKSMQFASPSSYATYTSAA